jgi:hypothetical protein
MDLTVDAWLDRYPGSASEHVTVFHEGVFDSSLMLPMTTNGDYCLPLHGIFAPSKYTGLQASRLSPSCSTLPALIGGTIFLGQSNYWHFLFDGLATLRGPFVGREHLYFREDVPDGWVQFVIHHLSTVYVHCNFSAERIPSGISRLMNVRSPWVGSLMGRIDRLRQMRGTLSRNIVGRKPGGCGIWVTRRSASKRRLLNEDELIEVAREIIPGLVVVDTANLDIPEQISLFSGADYVLGAHGAGLSNAIFCECPLGILEVWHSFNQAFFRSLADGLGCRYVQLEGTPSASMSDGRRSDDADFTVSITDFRDALDTLMA